MADDRYIRENLNTDPMRSLGSLNQNIPLRERLELLGNQRRDALRDASPPEQDEKDDPDEIARRLERDVYEPIRRIQNLQEAIDEAQNLLQDDGYDERNINPTNLRFEPDYVEEKEEDEKEEERPVYIPFPRRPPVFRLPPRPPAPRFAPPRPPAPRFAPPRPPQ